MKRTVDMEQPPATTPESRRASERSREQLLVSYTLAADIAPEFTQTYDIASGGLAMLTNTALPTNLEIIIELELRGKVRKLRVNGNVRWSTYDPLLQKYRTGVSFSGHSRAVERDLLQYIDTLHEIRSMPTM